MSSSTLVRRVEGVTSQPSGQRTVILNAAGTAMTTVNGIGSFIWNLLADPCTTAAIEAEIQQVYDITTDVARTDMAEFLGELQALGLIELDET